MFESWEFWVLYGLFGWGVGGVTYQESKMDNKIFWTIIFAIGWPVTLGSIIILTSYDIEKIIKLLENKD